MGHMRTQSQNVLCNHQNHRGAEHDTQASYSQQQSDAAAKNSYQWPVSLFRAALRVNTHAHTRIHTHTLTHLKGESTVSFELIFLLLLVSGTLFSISSHVDGALWWSFWAPGRSHVQHNRRNWTKTLNVSFHQSLVN